MSARAGTAALHGVNAVTMYQTLLAMAAAVGLLATAMAAPAQAVSIQDFFNADKGFSSDVRQGAERLALTTEAYRSLRTGQVDRAACIDEELIPKSATDASGFAGLQTDLLLARDKTQSVEGYILKAVDISCPASNAPNALPRSFESPSASAPKVVFQPTRVRDFYAEFPQALDKVRVLSVAFSTQALRTARAGYPSRGQCIRDKLVASRTPNDDSFIIPPEFQKAAGGLANAENVEELVNDSITLNCGAEGSTQPPEK